jgi:hypothetical protein
MIKKIVLAMKKLLLAVRENFSFYWQKVVLRLTLYVAVFKWIHTVS